MLQSKTVSKVSNSVHHWLSIGGHCNLVVCTKSAGSWT